MESLIRISQLLLILKYFGVALLAPNIVLIVTDDQDVVLKGLNPMKKTQQLIANEGATFVNAFTTSPVCCPSRSAILTGQYAHNTKTYNNSKTGGCYGTHWKNNLEPNALPVQLKLQGYSSFYGGKYLNEYFSTEVPPGWDHWFGLHGNSRYYNYTINDNGKIVTFAEQYLTDVLLNRTLNFINSVKQGPFFAMIAPPAPHAPFTAAERHQELFPEVKAYRTENFNIASSPLKKHWILTMPPSPLPADMLDDIDLIYRKRWQTLMAVDDMVEAIVHALAKIKRLKDTFIIYTSDNGYHMGQFSQPYDKRQPYETDIRVPFLVRGPTIAPKTLVTSPVALIDIVPTILEMANMKPPAHLDGVSVLNKLYHNEISERQLLIEYWGEGNAESYNPDCPWQKKDNLALCTTDAACHCQDSWNNTYSCVRHMAVDLDLKYCQFKDNEHHLYLFSELHRSLRPHG
ncbi:N-acetylglucosamine-6-sulfatase-like isoform X2 [Uranotaenia lowii]|uniref:N-acetylglucosamine-6-sulfatase-like isoform X2 n=1 Tax=Uranotaenia lowii TaxID=190385 RepID=UPI0024785BA0|nr:N-acetylglucosamine-6-sulfatase-like isoform X2 [Uranotaenia lowii]